MDGHVINPGLLILVVRVIGDKPDVIFIFSLQALNQKIAMPCEHVYAFSCVVVYASINNHGILVVDRSFHALTPPGNDGQGLGAV